MIKKDIVFNIFYQDYGTNMIMRFFTLSIHNEIQLYVKTPSIMQELIASDIKDISNARVQALLYVRMQGKNISNMEIVTFEHGMQENIEYSFFKFDHTLKI